MDPNVFCHSDNLGILRRYMPHAAVLTYLIRRLTRTVRTDLLLLVFWKSQQQAPIS